MALGTLPSAPEPWSRWPHHQHAGPDYSMMDAGIVSYDCRSGPATSISRPELTQHFLPGSYSPVSAPAPASPQYQTSVSYGGYGPYTQSPMLDTPFKPHGSLEHAQPRVVPCSPATAGGIQEPMDRLPHVERSCSPSIKSEAKSTMSESPPPSSKVVVPNMRVQGAPVHQFHTPVDNLLRVIDQSEILSPPNKAKLGHADEGADGGDTQQARGKPKRKRFCCDIPGCNKMFAQKNNLDTHRRAHTGESPFMCEICFHRFTQSVNLKSHMRRHMGERPYKCPQCPKAFSQPSNVKAHQKTHERRELRARWVCRFGNCKKSFTAKGNLKSHQNTYHVEAIEAFKARLAATEDKSMISEEDKEMARYIADVHNLANKGIKGRGKGRKVKRLLPHPMQQFSMAAITTNAAVSNNPMTTTAMHGNPYPMTLLPHTAAVSHHHLHAAAPAPSHHGQQQHFYGLSNPAAYSMSGAGGARPSAMLFGVGLGINTRDVPHHGPGPYGLLDSDQISEASSVHSPGPGPAVMHVYDDEHARELAFGERLY